MRNLFDPLWFLYNNHDEPSYQEFAVFRGLGQLRGNFHHRVFEML